MGIRDFFTGGADKEEPPSLAKPVIPHSDEAELLLQLRGWDDLSAWVTEQKQMLDDLLSRANGKSQELLKETAMEDIATGSYIQVDAAAETAAAAYEPLNSALSSYTALTEAMDAFAFVYDQAVQEMTSASIELTTTHYRTELIQAQANFDDLRSSLDAKLQDELAPSMAAVEMNTDTITAARAARREMAMIATDMNQREAALDALQSRIDQLLSEPADNIVLPDWCAGLEAALDEVPTYTLESAETPSELLILLQAEATKFAETLLSPMFAVDAAVMNTRCFVEESVPSLNRGLAELAGVGINCEVSKVTMPTLPSTGEANSGRLVGCIRAVRHECENIDRAFTQIYANRESTMSACAQSVSNRLRILGEQTAIDVGAYQQSIEAFAYLVSREEMNDYARWQQEYQGRQRLDVTKAIARDAQCGYRFHTPRQKNY